MSTAHNCRQNHLLAVLPVADFERLQPHLKPVPLSLGEVLYEPGIEARVAPISCRVRRSTVIDRAGLEARTCECYAVVKKECDRLLPDLIAT